MPLVFKCYDFLLKRLTATKNGRPCYLDRLSDEILVDQVFIYLDVIAILRLRLVSRLHYYLTHRPAVWKRLLRWADVALPPLPPTANHSLRYMIGAEAEHLLLRAVSLDWSWKHNKLSCMYQWDFDAYHDVLSMTILPGGHYLVASVADEMRVHYSIVVFSMDDRGTGAVPRAKMRTVTKAYNLQAKYMTVRGRKGIVVAYVHEDKGDFERGGNDSDGNVENESSQGLSTEYECVVLYVSLTSLEILADPSLTSGTDEFLQHTWTQSRPFRRLIAIRTASPLGTPSLDEIFDAPYVAISRGSNSITFKNLNDGAAATLICKPGTKAPIEAHSIVAFRLVSTRNQVLVVRRVDHGKRHLLVEYFNVLPSGDVEREEECSHTEGIGVCDMFPESIKISDDAVSTNQCIIPLSRGRRKGAARPPISIFGRAAKGKRLIRLTIYPDHKEPMLRPVEFTKPAQTAAGGWFAWLPLRWRSSAPAPTSTKPSGLPYAHKLAAYPLHHAAVTRLPWSSDVEARVLPGAYRAIAYFVRLEDQREEAPRILEFHCLSDPRSGSPAAAAAAAQNPCKPLLAAKFAVPREVEELRTVGALAWDETIGRLCIAEGNAMMVHVLDFAESPAFEAEQDFYVFEYPDTDIFDRPYSRKAHETRDVGPGSANEGDWEYSPGPSHGRSSGAGGPGGTTEAGCSYWPSGTQGAQSSREPDATKEAGCSYWPSALDGPEFSHCANGTKGAESSRDPDATKEAGCSIWPSALDGPESSHWENGTDRAESSNRPSRMNGVNRLPDEEMPDWMADWVNNNADLMNGAEEMNGAGQADSAGQGNCTDASVPMDTT